MAGSSRRPVTTTHMGAPRHPSNELPNAGKRGGPPRLRPPRAVAERGGTSAAATARWGLIALAWALAAAGCKSGPQELEPIAECVQIEQALEACTGHPQNIATQTAANPRDPAERERVRALCASDLVRVRRACR